MNTEYLQQYVTSLNAGESFKQVMVRILALSRRKRERLLQLATAEHARLEWNPEKDYDFWKAQEKPLCQGWFVVIGVAAGHSAIQTQLLCDPVATRTLRLLDALDAASSASDVAAIPE
jgi:hypothetical protein